MTSRNITRYMRVGKLIRPFKDRLDAGDLTLTAAVELSYLPENEQAIVAESGSVVNEKAASRVIQPYTQREGTIGGKGLPRSLLRGKRTSSEETETSYL